MPKDKVTHVQGSSGLRTGGLTTGRLRIGHVGDKRVLPGKRGAPTSDFGFYERYVRIYQRLIGGAAATTGPLQLVSGTGPTKLQVTSGLVNGQVPTLGGVALNAGTTPEITVAAGIWVWLKVIGTFGTPDSYVITVETSASSAPPTASAITATTFTTCLLVGSATFAGGEITGIETREAGHLGVDSFGAVNLWWGV